MLLHVLFSEHHAINTAHPSYSNFTGFQFLNASNTKLHVCVTSQPLVPLPLTFLNYCTCTAFPLSPLFIRHTHTKTPTLQPQNSWLSLFLLFRSSYLEQPPPRFQTLILSLPSKTNSRHFSSLSISTEYHCPSSQQSVQCC